MSVNSRYHRRSSSSVAKRPTTLLWLVALALVGLIITVIVMVLVSGCRAKAPVGRAKIAVSIFPVYDLVLRIAGPDADVVLVLPEGQSPHGYQPGADQVAALAGTKLGIAVGLGLDGWLDEALAAGAPSARVVRVGDRVPTSPLAPAAVAPGATDDKQDDDEATPDPHVWLDPQRARLLAKASTEEMARLDPPHANVFRRRAAEVDAALEALDHELEARMKPLAHRPLLTFHGAFAYFAERYHLDVVGVVEPVPGTPPTDARHRDLAALARAHGVTRVFREPQFVSAPAETLATHASLPIGTLDPLGPSANYETLMRALVAAIE